MKTAHTNISLEVFSTPDKACDFVAELMAWRIRERAAMGKPTVLGLATGSTPLRLYGKLVKLYRQGKVSFKNVITFNLDEYYGLDERHPCSYRRFMNEHLFSKVDIPLSQTHVPPGTVKKSEIAACCRDYEAAILRAGGIDIQILGIGRSGHIGFNEPGASLASRTRLVKLADITRRDAAPAFGGIENVPTHAITMGIRTILHAREIFMLAWGKNKSEIVAKAACEAPSSAIPATFLQKHPNAHICIDAACASGIARAPSVLA